jgi:hypothetical protein
MLLAVGLGLVGCHQGGGDSTPQPPALAVLATGPADCAAGKAGGFPCSGISLRPRLSHSAMGSSEGNDIWGWTDRRPNDGHGVRRRHRPDCTALSRTPTQTSASAWRDIKVYQKDAYVVADSAGLHGMQIVNDISNGLFVLGLDVLTVSAGADQSTFAGQSLLLEGTSSRPAAKVSSRQTHGTVATIADSAALVPAVTLPSSVVPETSTFELAISDGTGDTATDTIDIRADVNAQ